MARRDLKTSAIVSDMERRRKLNLRTASSLRNHEYTQLERCIATRQNDAMIKSSPQQREQPMHVKLSAYSICASFVVRIVLDAVNVKRAHRGEKQLNCTH